MTVTYRRIPRATGVLIAVNVILFLLAEIISGSTMDTSVLVTWGGAYVPYLEEGQYWRLLTSMFMHSGIRHLLNNMLLLYVLGAVLEDLLGSLRFAALYLLGGLGAGAAAWRYYLSRGEMVVSVGASGAIFAVMGALLFIVIYHRGRVRGLSLRQMMVMLLFSLYFGFTSADVSNIAHIAGLIIGFVLAIPLYLAGRGNRPQRRLFSREQPDR